MEMRKRSPLYGEAGFKRISNDFYETPAWVTQSLLDFLSFPQIIWEPACGNGAMSEVIKKYYDKVMYSDINADKFNYGLLLDFLKVMRAPPAICSIITNPPYRLAEEFINKALNLLQSRRSTMIAMLLRHEYDCAASRRYLFENRPFYAKLVLTRRPMWIANSTGSPRHNFSWYIWLIGYKGYPTTHYLPKKDQTNDSRMIHASIENGKVKAKG